MEPEYWILGIVLVIGLVIYIFRTNDRSRNFIWRRDADREGLARNSDIPVCDVCSQPVSLMEQYLLTTSQVTTDSAYWEFAFTHQWSYVHDLHPDGSLVASLVKNQAGQSTAWGLCESCSHLFEFDREIARKYTRSGRTKIPGGGPADVYSVATAAAMAWKKLFGDFPSSIRF